MIISHRGRGTGLAENSIAAFEAAFDAGADGIECDLRMTADERVIVHHGGTYGLRKLGVRRHTFADIAQIAQEESKALLTIDGLFDYIAQVPKPFYIEVKDAAAAMAAAVIDRIDRGDLWDRVSVVGFPVLINSAIRHRRRHTKLRTWRILLVPAIAHARLSLSGTGVFLGWQDSIPGAESLFRVTMPQARLANLIDRFRKRGIEVTAGVINRPNGFDFFRGGGVEDFVTDDIAAAVSYRASLDFSQSPG